MQLLQMLLPLRPLMLLLLLLLLLYYYYFPSFAHDCLFPHIPLPPSSYMTPTYPSLPAHPSLPSSPTPLCLLRVLSPLSIRTSQVFITCKNCGHEWRDGG